MKVVVFRHPKTDAGKETPGVAPQLSSSCPENLSQAGI